MRSYDPGGDVDYFQPTVEGNVESGMFGCVRSNGHRFHEGRHKMPPTRPAG